MTLLIKLLIAHIVGDFILQTNQCVREKERSKLMSPSLYLHTFAHGVLVLLFLWQLKYWPLAVSIMVAHYLIDVLKLYFQNESSKTQWFFIDQVAHIVSIVALWVLFIKPDFSFISTINTTTLLVYILALLFITVVSSIIMRELMSQWSISLNDTSDDSLKNAGKHIGMLERLFVFVFILTGQWEGIGFLLAAKSVFRFGDLKESKDRKLTEYILIGTLLSFGIAMGTGLTVLWLMKIV